MAPTRDTTFEPLLVLACTSMRKRPARRCSSDGPSPAREAFGQRIARIGLMPMPIQAVFIPIPIPSATAGASGPLPNDETSR